MTVWLTKWLRPWEGGRETFSHRIADQVVKALGGREGDL